MAGLSKDEPASIDKVYEMIATSDWTVSGIGLNVPEVHRRSGAGLTVTSWLSIFPACQGVP